MDERMQRPDPNPSAEQAAEWLMRLRAGRPADKRAFLRWLKRSPQNIGETLLATSTDIVLREYFRNRAGDVRIDTVESSNVIDISEPGSVPTKRVVSRRSWLLGTGLGLATAAALMLMLPSIFGEWWRQQSYETTVGEQRTVELADGSSLAINALSKVRVRYSDGARYVFLDEGQALFSVAKDAERPFRVTVGGSIVQAIGTRFDVRHRDNRTQVAVAEGAVQIAREEKQSSSSQLPAPTSVAKVSAGEAVYIATPGNVTSPMPINISEIGLWRQRRLVFRDDTLAEIAEEFGRYNLKPQLRIEGEHLRSRRLSGVFDADSPEALLIFFATDDAVVVERRNDEIVVRPRGGVVSGQ